MTSPSADHESLLDASVAESVAAMEWCEVHFELATRDGVEVPEGIEAMRAALVVVLIAERKSARKEGPA